MAFFRRKDDPEAGKSPPIWLIVLLVGFVLAAFLFIGFRQLRGAQERRLRLLAGFGARVESTVADLSDRFVRIVRVPPPEADASASDDGTGVQADARGAETSGTSGAADGPDEEDVPKASSPANPQPATQRKKTEIGRYLDHVPHLSLLKPAPPCRKFDAAGETRGGRPVIPGAQGSVGLSTAGARAYLRYCPPPGTHAHWSDGAAAIGQGAAEAGGASEGVVAGKPTGPLDRKQGKPGAEVPRGYLAEIDLEGLIEPMIIPGAFDSILVADERGQTLFQQGEPELRMLDLALLVEAVTSSRADGAVPEPLRALLDRSDPETVLDAVERWADRGGARTLALGARTAMVKAEIAGSEYFVFLQPVALRLQAGVSDGEGAGGAKRWIACGIISSENLLSAGLTTSPFLLFILVSILPLGIVTWPFLKLSLITRRQPFRRLDLAALVLATVLGVSLAALLVFDLLFLVRLHGSVDAQLRTLSGAIESRFRDELHDARSQLVQLNDREDERHHNDLLPSDETAEGLACRGENAPEGAKSDVVRSLADLTPVTFIKSADNRPGLDASAQFISEEVRPLIDGTGGDRAPIDLSTYPYFDSVFWVTTGGNHGCANLPLREHAVLPRNLVDRGYFLCARDCDPEPVFLAGGAGGGSTEGVRFAEWAPREASGDEAGGDGSSAGEVDEGCVSSFLETAPPGSSPVCLQSFLDRTTGESVAALAIPGPSSSFPVAALVTRLTSVGHPVLAPGFGFAIVEASGRVLFHSESRRDLSENFLKASDEDPLLESMLSERRGGHLSVHYWGRPSRVYVHPLTGLPWSLVTFRNTYGLRVRNFELIYDFLNPFLLYLGGLLIAVLALWIFAPRRYRRFLWPSSRHLPLYRAVALATPVVVAAFAVVLWRAPPAWILGCALFALPVLGVAASAACRLVEAIVDRDDHPHRDAASPGDSGTEGAGRTVGGEQPETPEEPSPLDRLGSTVWSALVRGGSHVRRSWLDKKRWLVVVPFLAACGIASAWLIFTETPVVPVFLVVVAFSVAGALVWHWHSFSGERRKIAYVFAAGCVLLVGALLPALGFLQLAQTRQAQLYTQDAQVGLARALEARERDIPRRQGPLRRLYDAYGHDLEQTRDAYLDAAFGSSWGAVDAAGDTLWAYARTDGTSRLRFVDRLLSSRPFPLNDLSARPVQSDLSRFDAPRDDWKRAEDGRIVLEHPRHNGRGTAIVLASTVPSLDVLPETLGIRTLGLLVGLLLLGMGPFLASELLAARVLLIQLVGGPHLEDEADRRHRTSVASAPLPVILDGVRKAEDVVRQVVLVSTLPGPDAWSDQVLGDRSVVEQSAEEPAADSPAPGDNASGGLPSDERDLEVGASRETDDEGPLFQRASFIDLWRQADSEAAAAATATAAGEEDGGAEPADPGDGSKPARAPGPSGGGEPASVGDTGSEPGLGSLRAQLFHQSLSPPEPSGEEEDPTRAEGKGDHGDDETSDADAPSSRPAPLLLTHFEPSLDDPDAAADQVAVLRFLTHEERRSVVILSETIPEPEMVLSNDRSQGDPRARRLWTKLLATYAVEHGHDAESDDLHKKRCKIDRELGDIRRDLEPTGAVREDLRTIDRNLAWIVRECSPTPVLRNIGRALLDSLEDTLPSVRRKVQLSSEDARPGDKPSRREERAYRLFQLFTREHMLAKVGSEARLHYRYLWSKCSPDEKLVLVQLAQHGLVNPKYFGWVMDLMNRGLVVRDPRLRVMNESFARFVRQEMQRSHILELQEEEGPSGWSVLKWILPAPLILVAAFLFVTQRDALSNLTGVLIAAVSLAPILVNLYGQFQEVNARRETKGGG